jgi:hypothetical protein
MDTPDRSIENYVDAYTHERKRERIQVGIIFFSQTENFAEMLLCMGFGEFVCTKYLCD